MRSNKARRLGKLVLELARREWISERCNACLIGAPGTGKTHVAIALGLAACRQGKRVRFVTAGDLVTQLEEAQKRYTLDVAVVWNSETHGGDGHL